MTELIYFSLTYNSIRV